MHVRRVRSRNQRKMLTRPLGAATHIVGLRRQHSEGIIGKRTDFACKNQLRLMVSGPLAARDAWPSMH